MEHQNDAKELLTKQRLAMNITVKEEANSPGHWFAICQIPLLGEIIQWGNTEQSALTNLRDYVTMVLKCDWPEESKNEMQKDSLSETGKS